MLMSFKKSDKETKKNFTSSCQNLHAPTTKLLLSQSGSQDKKQEGQNARKVVAARSSFLARFTHDMMQTYRQGYTCT